MEILKRVSSVILAVILIVCCTSSALAAEVNLLATSNEGDFINNTIKNTEIISTQSTEGLPSKYDSRELGIVLPARTQDANNCWAFGAFGSLETYLLKNGEQIKHLAPQHVNFWGTKNYLTSTGWQRKSSEPGYPYITTGYLTSWQGPLLEKQFPQTTDFSDYKSLTEMYSPTYGITGIKYIEGNLDEVKTAIIESGAVTANYHTNNSVYHNYSTNSYYCYDYIDTSRLSGHCVSIIGWDDDYPLTNFNEENLPPTNGAWLVKNSWSPNWGDNGCFWISYHDVHLFDSIFGMNYQYVNYQKIDENIKLYQNEVYGATYEFHYIKSDSITYMNCFDVDDSFREIDKVMFETTSIGSDYTIYYIPVEEDGTPTNSRNSWVKLHKGTVDYSGYICADIDNYLIEKGTQKVAIGVNINSTATDSDNSFGVSEWLTSSSVRLFVPDADYGLSYITFNGRNLDVMEFYKTYLNDDIGGTFVIKAITNKTVEPTLLGDSDEDGKVTILDVTAIQKHIAQIGHLSEQGAINADFNGDEKISILDATAIQKFLVGII